MKRRKLGLAGSGFEEKTVTHPLPPAMVHEYQKKGLIKFAFRKRLILKVMFLVVQRAGANKYGPEDRKAAASCRTPNRVFYRINYTSGHRRVKENFGVQRTEHWPAISNLHRLAEHMRCFSSQQPRRLEAEQHPTACVSEKTERRETPPPYRIGANIHEQYTRH